MTTAPTNDVATGGRAEPEAPPVTHRLWATLRPVRRRLLGLFLLLVLQVFGLLAGPRLVAYGIDSGMAKGDMGAVNLAAGLYLGLAVMALVLGRIVVWGVSEIAYVTEGDADVLFVETLM